MGSGNSARRLRSAGVQLGAVTFLALTVTSCASSSSQRVCADRTSMKRVNDSLCNSSSTGTGWYYLPRKSSKPSLGKGLGGGSFSKADVDRGGFGSSSGSSSSGG